jgi:hypothetical protein
MRAGSQKRRLLPQPDGFQSLQSYARIAALPNERHSQPRFLSNLRFTSRKPLPIVSQNSGTPQDKLRQVLVRNKFVMLGKRFVFCASSAHVPYVRFALVLKNIAYCLQPNQFLLEPEMKRYAPAHTSGPWRNYDHQPAPSLAHRYLAP